MNVKAEAAKIREAHEINEKKIKDKLEEDIKFIRENYQREIERETENLKNSLDIELQKLRTETEEKVHQLSKDRYKDLILDDKKITPSLKNLKSEMSENYRRNRKRIMDDLQRDKEAYEEACKGRRARFEQQMQLIHTAQRETHLLEFLKQNVVELCTAKGPIKIADECVLDSRAKININRNAIVSGHSWALYKCTMDKKQVLGLVVALKSIPIELRRDYERACKCIRFLCTRENVMHPNLLRVYQIYTTDHKRYTFMEEFNDTSLDRVLRDNQKNGVQYDNIIKWTKQMVDVFAFTHKFAIAHLNIRPESFIFTNEANIKVVGMSRMFPYFNLDQEKILRAEKLLALPHNSHMPPETFEEDFRPEAADVWSFGLIIYEFFAKKRPEIMKAVQSGRRIKIKICWDHLNLKKIKNDLAKYLVIRCCNNIVITRPHFEDLPRMDFFTGKASSKTIDETEADLKSNSGQMTTQKSED